MIQNGISLMRQFGMNIMLFSFAKSRKGTCYEDMQKNDGMDTNYRL